jgi:serine O-acetyltransferase
MRETVQPTGATAPLSSHKSQKLFCFEHARARNLVLGKACGEKMIHIATLGCLATRNSCNYFDATFVRSNLYAPKISLIALFGNPVDHFELALNNLDPFRRDIVSRDLKKTFWQEIQSKKPDILLVDFAEEVYDLLATHDGKSYITNSDYLSINATALLGDKLGLIKKESTNFDVLWRQACKSFSEKVASSQITTVLIRLRAPERFASKDNICPFDDAALEKITHINARLDHLYSVFQQTVGCLSINIPADLLISQFSGGKKIGIADYTNEIGELIAAKVATACGLEKHLIPSPNAKVDLYLNEFARLLDAGDIPTAYELYTRGKALKLAGDEKGAIRCERLITLLRNSSVPLTAELGKIKFGNGVTINGNARIGDYVTIGANVTVGGGSSHRDKDGVSRSAPTIGNRVYIATGAKVLGGIQIGNHCIIGANAVITKDIPDFSVAAGIPGKVIAKITPENLSKYSGYLYKGVALSDVRKLMFGS